MYFSFTKKVIYYLHFRKRDKMANLTNERKEKLLSELVRYRYEKENNMKAECTVRINENDEKCVNIIKKEILKNLIDLIDEQDTETIFRVLIRFVPEDTPLPDEIEAITKANKSLNTHEAVSHEDVNWD